MIRPCICDTEDEIRKLVTDHGKELRKEHQELKVKWGDMQFPLHCLFRGYEPKGAPHEYADCLFFHDGMETVMIVNPRQLTHFEVLATRRMNGDEAYRQMKEMERSAGLDPED